MARSRGDLRVLYALLTSDEASSENAFSSCVALSMPFYQSISMLYLCPRKTSPIQQIILKHMMRA